MHPNPVYHHDDLARNLDFARAQAFGTLCINATPSPLISHVPFLLDSEGKVARLHLVRSNPIARRVKSELPAVIAVQGPHGYISPDWYGIDDQVPTWNYIAVHLRGRLHRLPDETLRDVIDSLSAEHEARLHPKPPWHSDKMTPEVLSKMMRQIVPFELHIEHVNATWKLNQNKSDEVRLNAADNVEKGHGSDLADLAILMRALP